MSVNIHWVWMIPISFGENKAIITENNRSMGTNDNRSNINQRHIDKNPFDWMHVWYWDCNGCCPFMMKIMNPFIKPFNFVSQAMYIVEICIFKDANQNKLLDRLKNWRFSIVSKGILSWVPDGRGPNWIRWLSIFAKLGPIYGPIVYLFINWNPIRTNKVFHLRGVSLFSCNWNFRSQSGLFIVTYPDAFNARFMTHSITILRISRKVNNKIMARFNLPGI